MKKLILATLVTLSVFSQMAQAASRVVNVVSGSCESLDGKYSTKINGTTVIQTDGPCRADLFQVQITDNVTENVFELLSIDGEVNNLVYSISDDGKRLNVNYFDFNEKAHEADMICVTKVNARAMKSFTKKSR